MIILPGLVIQALRKLKQGDYKLEASLHGITDSETKQKTRAQGYNFDKVCAQLRCVRWGPGLDP